MDPMPPMDAIFSTHLGQYQPRPALSGPIVIRSSPDDDQDSMIAKLRQQFPLHCKAIVAPVTNIHQWFDQHDTYRHGYGFLHSVLATIAFQNSKEVHGFVERWRTENRERFVHNSGVMFTKAEITEHGSGFLAEAAQQIYYLRASLQHGSSRFIDPSRDHRVESYHGRGGPIANHASRPPRHNSSVQPFVTKRLPVPQGGNTRNPKTSANQMSNHSSDLSSNPIPIHVSTQVPVRQPRPHPSARRVDCRSDPEEYSYRPPIVPSQGAPGLFPYRRIPVSARLPQARYPSVEIVPADPSSHKVFSNDARVLEMQEQRSRTGSSDNNLVDMATAQQPVRYPSQVHQSSAETQNLTHSTSAWGKDSSLTNDPAVVFVGNKAGNGNYQSHVPGKQREDHLRRGSEQHPSEPLRDDSPLRQWSTSSTVVTWDENDQAPAIPHPALENHQVFQTHHYRNSHALDQRSNTSSEQLQGSPTPPLAVENDQASQTHNHGNSPALDQCLNTSSEQLQGSLPPPLAVENDQAFQTHSLGNSPALDQCLNTSSEQLQESPTPPLAVENHQVFQTQIHSPAVDQCLNTSSEQLQGSLTRVVIPNHEQLSSSGHGRWPSNRSDRNVSTGYDEHKIFIRNLPAGFPKTSIKELFDPGYSIIDVSNVKLSQQRESRGYAFVTFEKASDAARAVKTMDSTAPASIGGRRLLVKHAFRNKMIQHSQQGSGSALPDDTLGSAMGEKPWMVSRHDLPENLIDQGRGPDSDALVGGSSGQFPKTIATGESPDKVSLQSPESMNPNQKRTSKKESISSSRSSHSKTKSVQKAQCDSSATDLPLNSKAERNTKPKHEAKSNKNRIATLEKEGTVADAPGLNLEQFPPLVASHSKNLSKSRAAQESPETIVSQEPQVKTIEKEATAKENERPVFRPDRLDREQKSSSIGMVRGESASTAQSVPENTSALATEPTSDAYSELSICNTNEPRVPVEKVAATEPLPTSKSPTNTDNRLSQHVIELGSSEVDCPKATAHDVITADDLSHSVSLSTSTSNVVAKIQAEEPEKGSPVVSIAPQKPPVHSLKSALDTPSVIKAKAQPGEDESYVTPTKKPKASTVNTSSVTSFTASDQISSAELPKTVIALESNSSEVPLRTNSLSTSSPPIMTHKKKKKVFTPEKVEVKTEIDQGHQPMDSTDLTPIRNIQQENTDHQAEKSNISESKGNIEENHEELEILQKAALPSTEPGKESICKQEEDTTQRPPTSATNQPKKSKRKGAARRQKSKSKAVQASSVADNETTVDSGSEKSQAQKNLPAPETPYLLDDKYILPQVTSNNRSQATENVNPQISADKRKPALCIQALCDQDSNEFQSCDTFEKYAHLKGRIYEPYAAYTQNQAPFSSIHSSRLLNSDTASEDIQPRAHSIADPKPPGLAQPLAWADQGPPRLRSWGFIDDIGALPALDSYESYLESAFNNPESNCEDGKARADSSQSSDNDIEIEGTPDDSDNLPERNLKSGSLSSGTDTSIDSKINLASVEDHCSIPDMPTKEGVTQASDLPFRQLYSNLNSSPEAKSTMTVLTSSFSPPSPLPFPATVDDDPLTKGGSEHQTAEVATMLPEPTTPGKAEPSVSTNTLSAAGATPRKQDLDLLISQVDDLILDVAAKMPVPSTPRGRKHKGHQRGDSSGTVSSCSTARGSASATRSTPDDSQHLSEAFAAITARNQAEFAARLERARCEAPVSPPRTPTHRPFRSYAAAALSPTHGSPTVSIGEVLQLGGPVVGGKSVSGAASEDQSFVNLKDRMEVGPSVKNQKQKQKSGSDDDPWRVPKGEVVWGSGTSGKGSRSGNAKGSGTGAHQSP